MLIFSETVVILAVFCCFIDIQGTNTADPSQEKSDQSDSSSGKWLNDKPVKKTEESLCLSYNGSNKQRKLCTVVIGNQSITSDVDQEGYFGVYQNKESCILCMHNLHFANDNTCINKNIHLEYGLHRIVSTTLKDILEKGLVDYKNIIKNDQEAEIYIMNYGLQAKCTSTPIAVVNKTVITTKLIFKDGEIVKLQQTRILYNRCSSFNISCSFGRMDYPLDIAKDNCENNGEGKSTGTIVGVVVGLLVLLIITLVIVLVKKRKDDRLGLLGSNIKIKN